MPNPNPSPEELITAAEMAKMSALMPFLEREVTRNMERIEAQADSMLQRGELDPQKAMNLWVEHLTWRRVYRGFAQRAAYGAEVGAKLGTNP